MPDFLHADKENFSDEELMQEEQIRPQSFKDFAGQRKTLDNLEVFVAAAKNRGGALDHVLLHGPPGLGKTTLAHIIANELGVNCKITSGPVLDKPGSLAGLLTNLEENKAGGVYEVYTTNPDGQEVWQIDLGYALNGSAQGSVYQTPKLFGSPENVEDIKNAYEIQVVYKPSNASEYLTAQYRIGGTGDWSAIEGSSNNVSLSGTDEIKVERLILPPKAAGKFVELKLSHSSSGAGFNLYGLNLIYDVEAKENHQ